MKVSKVGATKGGAKKGLVAAGCACVPVSVSLSLSLCLFGCVRVCVRVSVYVSLSYPERERERERESKRKRKRERERERERGERESIRNYSITRGRSTLLSVVLCTRAGMLMGSRAEQGWRRNCPSLRRRRSDCKKRSWSGSWKRSARSAMRRNVCAKRRQERGKVLYTVTFYTRYTRALTFENAWHVWQEQKMREETMRLIREEEDRIRKREEMFKVISRVVSVKSPCLPSTRPRRACLCVCARVYVCVWGVTCMGSRHGK